MTRSVLVLGATGTTGSRVAELLRRDGHLVRAVSRSTSPAFDWDVPATWDAAVEAVDAVYLLPPVGVADAEPQMTAFIERALDAGVRRFVLLSASIIPKGAPGVGRIHALLEERAPEWSVLQPSWFMQNFEAGHYMAEDVRSGRLVTSIQDGRVAFVDADDIAAVAVRALLDDIPHQTAHVITGPEALSYDEVAALLSDASGREIRHERVTQQQVQDRIARSGIPATFAEVLAALEESLRAGGGAAVTDTVERVTGRPPRRFAEWAGAHTTALRAELPQTPKERTTT